MALQLTYAGVQLGFPDADGAIQRWVDRYRPLDDIFNLAKPASVIDGRERPQGQAGHATGLPTFNWQHKPPRYRLNSLWWPCTGASRFAIGLFVTNLVNAKAIQTALKGGNGSAEFAMNDSIGRLSTLLWALPMRPLGAIGTSNYPLVLVPLVDRRYWWQWSKMDEVFTSPTSTWADINITIAASLGVTVTFPEPVGYDGPDALGFNRWHENAALMMDAYAATVGQRFVADFDGTYACQKADAAGEISDTDATDAQMSAGGDFLSLPSDSPGHLAVVFPRRQGGVIYQDGACDTVTLNGPNTSAPGTAVVHTTFQADWSSRGVVADNQAAMETLAGAIKRDFYEWRTRQYSGTIPAVAYNWVPSGFDDYLWFHFGTPADFEAIGECGTSGAPWLAHTLVESMPHNLGVEENLAQLRSPTAPRTMQGMPLVRAQLTSAWTEGSGSYPDYATARLLSDHDAPSMPQGILSQDGFDVKVFDTLGGRGGSKSGDKVWVSALGDTQMFELVSSPAAAVALYRGITTAAMTKGSLVSSANVDRYNPGTTTLSGDHDIVQDEMADIGIGKVVYYQQDGAKKYVYAAECPLT